MDVVVNWDDVAGQTKWVVRQVNPHVNGGAGWYRGPLVGRKDMRAGRSDPFVQVCLWHKVLAMKSIRYLAVLALVLAACSPSGSDATTTTAAATATTGEGGVTSTTAPPGTTTTLVETTTTQALDVDANAVVMAKTAAVEAAVPDGWTAMTGPATTDQEADESFYLSCLQPDDLDIDNLDELSDAALLTQFEGPPVTPPFPGQRGSIEARVFESEDVASDAFAVFERVFGTEEGLECMIDSVQSLAGDDLPTDELVFSTEEVTIEGSQAGARFEMSFDISGFDGAIYVEFQGARMGACTVIASFITFGEPFDRDVADSLFGAAVNA